MKLRDIKLPTEEELDDNVVLISIWEFIAGLMWGTILYFFATGDPVNAQGCADALTWLAFELWRAL